jgi:RNA polymerase sigma factor (sigma-70 family)
VIEFLKNFVKSSASNAYLLLGRTVAGRGVDRGAGSTCHALAMDRPSEGQEQQIARWIRQGESRGFSLLMQHYGGRVAGFLRQRFPSLDDHDVHDALADAMLALADSFDPDRGSLPAWFLFLAQQRAVGRLRTQRSQPLWVSWTVDLEPADAGATPLEELATHERLLEMEEVIRSLSRLEQAVVQADLDEGGAVSAQDLAMRLHTTAGSVYAARQRARRKLLARCPWISQMLGEGDSTNDETA